jgi:hypothetical protein
MFLATCYLLAICITFNCLWYKKIVLIDSFQLWLRPGTLAHIREDARYHDSYLDIERGSFLPTAGREG